MFATNKLVIVTKPGNPKDVKTLADLADLQVVSLCADTVPCGKYAAQILPTAGVTIPESNVTRGQDVKATLGGSDDGRRRRGDRVRHRREGGRRRGRGGRDPR